jgi:hypothetical protein
MPQHHSESGPPCPSCGSRDVARIVYGHPWPKPHPDDSGEAAERARALWEGVESGRIVLGGCCIFPNAPEWHCHPCGHRWRLSRHQKSEGLNELPGGG